jgi:hypothetical protein
MPPLYVTGADFTAYVEIGEEALAGPTPGDVKGPDFEVSYPGGKGRPRYSSKIAGELAPLARYRVRGARAVA